MKSTLYMPLLRAKNGEIEALGWLSPYAKSRICPLFDIPKPNAREPRILSEYLGEKVNSLSDSWGVDLPLWIDLSRFAPDSRTEKNIHPVKHVFDIANQRRLQAIPVTGTELSRGPGLDYLNAVSKINKKHGRGIALRFHYHEFCDKSKFKALVEKTCRLLNVSPKECDVILDLEALDRLPQLSRVNEVEAVLRSTISSINVMNFRDVIVCGSSIPEVVGPKFNGTPCRVERVEFAAWKKLVINREYQRIGFGDYGIIYPLISDSGGSGSPPARIRLSTDTDHFLYRSPRNSYRLLSKKVAREEAFNSQASCWGKKCIAGLGGGYTGVGSPSNWVARDTNVHIESTVVEITRKLVGAIKLTPNDFDVDEADHFPQSELEYLVQ